jgi:hypothetical protein
MPHAGLWRQELAGLLGPGPSQGIMARVEARYADLYAGRTHYDNRALRQHLEENILPGLALYQVLREDGHHTDAALKTVERLFAADLMRRRRSLERLGRLPFFFALLRAVTRRFMARNFPPEGWEVEWPDAGRDVVAFDMQSCFYLDVLTEYGAPELTPVYCRLDDLIYEDLSPHVRWERTKTLGRGDDCCDFRFRRAR